MAIEFNELDIDRQIDAAFGVIFTTDIKLYMEVVYECMSEKKPDMDYLETAFSLNPVLYPMARDLFSLLVWTLLKTADFDRGHFASPFMNAIHCFEEGGTVCSLSSDPKKYFVDKECTELAPAIVYDVDTILHCCFENGMHPALFLKDALKGLIDFTDTDDRETRDWYRPALRFQSIMVEMEKYPNQIEEVMNSLLDMMEQFFFTPFYECNTFHLKGCCLRCDKADECRTGE